MRRSTFIPDSIISVSFGIPGVIGSYAKKVGVVGLVFGGVSVVWGILRIALVLSAAAQISSQILIF